MMASRELSTAALHFGAALVEFEIGAKSKDALAEDIGNLLALLEVYTDENFNEEEQNKLFQSSGHRIEELKARLVDIKRQADSDVANAPPHINPENEP
jgi:hypothetical protein